MNVIVAYDVSDDDRRARLAATLGTYGVRIQRSVFECVADDATLDEIRARIAALVNPDRDVVQIFHQCDRCRTQRTGIGQVDTTLDTLFGIV